eukprot:6208951-Pleurochrysis_carterae.AAC.1
MNVVFANCSTFSWPSSIPAASWDDAFPCSCASQHISGVGWMHVCTSRRAAERMRVRRVHLPTCMRLFIGSRPFRVQVSARTGFRASWRASWRVCTTPRLTTRRGVSQRRGGSSSAPPRARAPSPPSNACRRRAAQMDLAMSC